MTPLLNGLLYLDGREEDSCVGRLKKREKTVIYYREKNK